jgi:hypothetical protein
MPSTIRGSDNFDSAYGAALKAWVNFNGTGVVAIRASLNVSSITDNGTGDYTINLTSALSDTNYSVAISGAQDTAGGNFVGFAHGGTYTSSAVRVKTVNGSFAATDMQNVSIELFR